MTGAATIEEHVDAIEMTMAKAITAGLDSALQRDPRVLLLGEDIADPAGGVFKVTNGLSSRHGTERVRAMPIAEQAIIGAAIGAAIGGYRPVAEIMFFDFMAVCMDQVVNHAAKLRYMSGGLTPVPITIRTVVGTPRFGPQHSQSLEAWFMHTPGLKVIMPSTPADAKGLLLTSIADDDPCLFIEHADLLFAQKGLVPTGDLAIPLGEAAVRRAGSDVSIVTYGSMVPVVLDAAERLASEGVDAEVIDLRTLVPLDREAVLRSVAKTKRAVVAHAATTFCGAGAEIASMITEELFSELSAPVARVGARNAPVAFAPELEVLPTADRVVTAARSLTA